MYRKNQNFKFINRFQTSLDELVAQIDSDSVVPSQPRDGGFRVSEAITIGDRDNTSTEVLLFPPGSSRGAGEPFDFFNSDNDFVWCSRDEFLQIARSLACDIPVQTSRPAAKQFSTTVIIVDTSDVELTSRVFSELVEELAQTELAVMLLPRELSKSVLLASDSSLRKLGAFRHTITLKTFSANYIDMVQAKIGTPRWLSLLAIGAFDYFDSEVLGVIGNLTAKEATQALDCLIDSGIIQPESTLPNLFRVRWVFRNKLQQRIFLEFGGDWLQDRRHEYASWIEKSDPSILFHLFCSSGDLDQAEVLLAQNFSFLTDQAAQSTGAILLRVGLEVLGPYPILQGARFLAGLSDPTTPRTWLERSYLALVNSLPHHGATFQPFQQLGRAALLSALNRALGDGVTALQFAQETSRLLETLPPSTYQQFGRSIPLLHAMVSFTYSHLDHFDLAMHQNRLCTSVARTNNDLQEIARGLSGQLYVRAVQGEIFATNQLVQQVTKLSDQNPGKIYLGQLNFAIGAAYAAIEQGNYSSARELLDSLGSEYLRLEYWPRIAWAQTILTLLTQGALPAQAELEEILWLAVPRPPIVETLDALLRALMSKISTSTGDLDVAHRYLSACDSRQPAILLARTHLLLQEEKFQPALDLAQTATELISRRVPAAHRLRTESSVYVAYSQMRLGQLKNFKSSGARLLRTLETTGLHTPVIHLGENNLKDFAETLQRSGFPSAHNLLLRQTLEKNSPVDVPDLSATETTVLRSIAEHKTVLSTAEVLFLSPNTIKFHLKNIYRKLAVETRKEALARANMLGLLD